MIPMPTPHTTKPGSRTAHDEVACTWDISSHPAATSSSPRLIMRRDWIRTVSLPATGATMNASMVSGRNRSPAWNGL